MKGRRRGSVGGRMRTRERERDCTKKFYENDLKIKKYIQNCFTEKNYDGLFK